MTIVERECPDLKRAVTPEARAIEPRLGVRDVLECEIWENDPEVLSLLLLDRSMTAYKGVPTNIVWASDDHARDFPDDPRFAADRQILPELITLKGVKVICPRVDKRLEEQRRRSVEKAEVFTPSWICNAQNNLIDNAWFGGRKAVFNLERPNPRTNLAWTTLAKPVTFAKKLKKGPLDYIRAPRLEVSCGEAPYLTSRYDTTTGEWINPSERIGFLDRKLRIVSEIADDELQWISLAGDALKSCYGFEWQGDNVLLARENLLYAVLEMYEDMYGEARCRPRAILPIKVIRDYAEIISWNIWQMDGIKCVVPNTCGLETDLAGPVPCMGCRKNSNRPEDHNGYRCLIRNWPAGTIEEFLPKKPMKVVWKEGV